MNACCQQVYAVDYQFAHTASGRRQDPHQPQSQLLPEKREQPQAPGREAPRYSSAIKRPRKLRDDIGMIIVRNTNSTDTCLHIYGCVVEISSRVGPPRWRAKSEHSKDLHGESRLLRTCLNAQPHTLPSRVATAVHAREPLHYLRRLGVNGNADGTAPGQRRAAGRQDLKTETRKIGIGARSVDTSWLNS